VVAGVQIPVPRFLNFRLLFLWATLLLCFPAGRAQTNEQRTNFFLPKNPVAAAYILGRLSNGELIQAPRSEFVYVALLQRAGLERKYRLEALDGLAKLRQTDPIAELLGALVELDKKSEDVTSTLRDLAPILLQFTPQELAAKRGLLEKLTTESRLPLTRQLGHAAIITADNSLEQSWRANESQPKNLVDVLLAIPLLRDGELRATAFPKIEPLVNRADSPEIRRAAISVLASVPRHETESFKILAALLQTGAELPASIASLQQIPPQFWPKDIVPPLINSLTN